jgi:putative oxygen-independent coproporphyrinogen III oxidase
MSGLYFHIPFCLRKCPYCDFFSVVGSSEQLAEYVHLLLAHMELSTRGADNSEPVDTVFFGGGTPSLLNPNEIGKILDRVDRLWGVSGEPEITIEANPGTLSQEKLEGYRAAGINRLSLGVQTFNPDFLKALGRVHSLEDVEKSLVWARRAGLENISIDLIFGLPGQSLECFSRDLERAWRADPQHLSLYGLTVETGTAFASLQGQGKLCLPGEETYADMFKCGHDFFCEQGYSHYEISNYSKPGFQCRHNLSYWKRQSCMGFGAGAHSFSAHSWGERWASPPDLAHYSRCLKEGRDPAQRLEVFNRAGAMSETLYLGLRTAEGVREENFLRCFGQTLQDAFPDAMESLKESLFFKDGCWRMTFGGWLIYDFLIQKVL